MTHDITVSEQDVYVCDKWCKIITSVSGCNMSLKLEFFMCIIDVWEEEISYHMMQFSFKMFVRVLSASRMGPFCLLYSAPAECKV